MSGFTLLYWAHLMKYSEIVATALHLFSESFQTPEQVQLDVIQHVVVHLEKDYICPR